MKSDVGKGKNTKTRVSVIFFSITTYKTNG